MPNTCGFDQNGTQSWTFKYDGSIANTGRLKASYASLDRKGNLKSKQWGRVSALPSFPQLKITIKEEKIKRIDDVK